MTDVWLPPEIWGVILGFSSDAETFLSLAMTCKDFGHLAHEENMQEKMKRQFAREIKVEVREIYFALPNGVKHGAWTTWHWNGKKQAKTTYRDGKEEGRWTVWHWNGKICEEGTYRDGKKEGTWMVWGEDGEKWMEMTYQDGKMEEMWVNRGEKRQRQDEGAWENGTPRGFERVFVEGHPAKRRKGNVI